MEEALIGSVLITPDAYLDAAPLVSAEDFYLHRNRWIWEAMVRLSEHRQPLDLLLVADDLEEHSQLEEIGGRAYLISLVNQTPSAMYAVSYGEVVKEMSIRRRMLTAANNLARMAHTRDQSLDTIIGEAEKAIFGLKEDQAQNTCIFSTGFAMKMMGDVQEFFIRNGVRNYYSVSISGYHIAEAGANPISQLAFTLSNGFTFVEAYLARGMHVDDFAPNLSFFFSNGMDPEYVVIGRVARRIWARAMRERCAQVVADGRPLSVEERIEIGGSPRTLHTTIGPLHGPHGEIAGVFGISRDVTELHTLREENKRLRKQQAATAST